MEFRRAGLLRPRSSVDEGNCHRGTFLRPMISPLLVPGRRRVRSAANETKKIGTGQVSAGSIGPRCGEKGFRRTFRWECFLCTSADPAPQPARTSRDCSQPESSLLPTAGHTPKLGDSKASEIQSSPG